MCVCVYIWIIQGTHDPVVFTRRIAVKLRAQRFSDDTYFFALDLFSGQVETLEDGMYFRSLTQPSSICWCRRCGCYCCRRYLLCGPAQEDHTRPRDEFRIESD